MIQEITPDNLLTAKALQLCWVTWSEVLLSSRWIHASGFIATEFTWVTGKVIPVVLDREFRLYSVFLLPNHKDFESSGWTTALCVSSSCKTTETYAFSELEISESMVISEISPCLWASRKFLAIIFSWVPFFFNQKFVVKLSLPRWRTWWPGARVEDGVDGEMIESPGSTAGAA